MSTFITSRKLWLGLGGGALFLALFFWRTDLPEIVGEPVAPSPIGEQPE